MDFVIVLLHFETQTDQAKSNQSTSMHNNLVRLITNIGQSDLQIYKSDEISPVGSYPENQPNQTVSSLTTGSIVLFIWASFQAQKWSELFILFGSQSS